MTALFGFADCRSVSAARAGGRCWGAASPPGAGHPVPSPARGAVGSAHVTLDMPARCCAVKQPLACWLAFFFFFSSFFLLYFFFLPLFLLSRGDCIICLCFTAWAAGEGME